MMRVTVTLLNETEDNSYVAYASEEDLLEVMTEVYHEVISRIEGEWEQVELPLDMKEEVVSESNQS